MPGCLKIYKAGNPNRQAWRRQAKPGRRATRQSALLALVANSESAFGVQMSSRNGSSSFAPCASSSFVVGASRCGRLRATAPLECPSCPNVCPAQRAKHISEGYLTRPPRAVNIATVRTFHTAICRALAGAVSTMAARPGFGPIHADRLGTTCRRCSVGTCKQSRPILINHCNWSKAGDTAAKPLANSGRKICVQLPIFAPRVLAACWQGMHNSPLPHHPHLLPVPPGMPSPPHHGRATQHMR